MAWDDSSPTTTNKILDDVVNIYDNLQFLYDRHTVQDLGHKVGLTVRRKDDDELYIDSGSIRISSGSTSEIYGVAEQLTKSVTSLDGSQWYYVYVDPPDSGVTLAAADIEYNLNVPTFDQSKCGWYHPTSTDMRCIGFFYSSDDATPTIKPFTVCGRYYLFDDWTASLFSSIAMDTLWYPVTAGQPLGEISAFVEVVTAYLSGVAGYLKARRNGDTGSGFYVGYAASNALTSCGEYFIPTASNYKFEFGFTSSLHAFVYINQKGFILPKGI